MNHKLTIATQTLTLGKGNCARAANVIRLTANFPEAIAILKKVTTANNKNSQYLIGYDFADNWSQVWNTYRPKSLPNLHKSINWNTAVFCHFGVELTEHYKLRFEVENSMMNGHWSIAEKKLDRHREKFGPTLWNLRWQLLLQDERGGSRDAVVSKMGLTNLPDAVRYFMAVFDYASNRNLTASILKKGLRETSGALDKYMKPLVDLTVGETVISTAEINNALVASDLLPIIDRYEIFLKALVSLSSHPKDFERSQRSISRLKDHCGDACIIALFGNFEEEAEGVISEANTKSVKCWDYYIAGDYIKAEKCAKEVVSMLPTELSNYELQAKSDIYRGALCDCADSTPSEKVYRMVYSILSRGDDMENALSELYKFSMRYPFYTTGRQIDCFIQQQSTSSILVESSTYACYASLIRTPRSMEFVSTSKENLEFLKGLKKRFEASTSIRFFYNLVDEKGLAEGGVPRIRELYFKGLYQMRAGKLMEASSLLSDFLDEYKNPKNQLNAPFAVEEVSRLLVTMYADMERVVLAQKMIVESIHSGICNQRILPVRKVHDVAINKRAEASKEIHYPILSHLASSEPHDVSMALKRFLKYQRLEKPSDIVKNSSLVECLGFGNITNLFVNVCTPNVLDSLSIFDTETKVEDERLLLLKWVADNATGFEKVAENQKLKLIRNSQLRKALDRIDESRVVLNLSSLREAEEESFQDIYDEYKSNKELTIANVTRRVVDTLQLTSDGSPVRVISFQDDEADIVKAFTKAVRKMREVFFKSPHFGLEACLSGRIRHGILVQHLLRAFRSQNLIVPKDQSERDAFIDYWTRKLENINGRFEQSELFRIMSKLSNELTNEVVKVKDKWIQASSSEDQGEALFNYHFNDFDINKLYKTIENSGDTFDVFLDNVLHALSGRIETSLPIIRGKINNELKPKITRIVNDAIGDLQEFEGVQPLKNSCITARQSSETSCDEFQRWFNRAEGIFSETADLDLIGKTAIGMIERLNPDYAGKNELNVDSTVKIKGQYFISLVHMLFFLIENSVTHSTSYIVDYKGDLRIDSFDNKLVISMTNTMSDTETANIGHDKIEAAIKLIEDKFDPEKVIREGGSGLAKVKAAIQYEFKQDKVDFEVSADGPLLTVKIQARIEGLVV